MNIREVEKKVRLETDLAAFEAEILQKGFTKTAQLNEQDTYFTDIKGAYIQDRTCLRIRTTRSNEEITFEKTYKGPSATNAAIYSKLENNQHVRDANHKESIVEELKNDGFYPYSTVVKNRTVYSKAGRITKNIMIDSINTGESFVEFEILAPEEEITDLTTVLEELINSFSDKHAFSDVNKPYRDIVAEYVASQHNTPAVPTHMISQFSSAVIETYQARVSTSEEQLDTQILEAVEYPDQILLSLLYAHNN